MKLFLVPHNIKLNKLVLSTLLRVNIFPKYQVTLLQSLLPMSEKDKVKVFSVISSQHLYNLVFFPILMRNFMRNLFLVWGRLFLFRDCFLPPEVMAAWVVPWNI